MNTAEILEQLRSGRAAWQAVVDQIPLDRLNDPVGDGAWTAKDEIAHVTFYDRWTAGTLRAHGEGRPATHDEQYDHPGEMPAYQGDIDRFNAVILERYAAMSSAEVLVATRCAFDDLAAAVEALPEHLWDEPAEFARGRILAEVMPGQTWVHYAKHLPSLQALVARE